MVLRKILIGFSLLFSLLIFNYLYQPIERIKIASKSFDQPIVMEIDNFKFRDLNRNKLLDEYEDFRNATSLRVDDLLKKMTLEEKVGQMMHPAVSINPDMALRAFHFAMGRKTLDESNILERHITHFNFYGNPSPKGLAKRLNYLQRVASKGRLGIPLSISSDPLHEVKGGGIAAFSINGFSKWPSQLGFAATRDSKLIEKFGEIASKEYRAVGIHTALHPMADLATDPRWARNFGTFGSNADLASEFTDAYMRGFQGKELSSESVMTMVKHFPGGGPQENGLDAHLPSGKNQIYPGNNFDYHVLPFVKAINNGLRAIMPYYGIPMGQTSEDVAMGFNRNILTGLLRDELAFEGVVCSDWGIISGRPWGVESLSESERYEKAILAGVDQFGGENDVKKVINLVQTGKISESLLDRSVGRILTNKFDLGLFERPFVDESLVDGSLNKTEYKRAGLNAQKRSVVLLKNSDMNEAVLPISSSANIYIEGLSAEVGSQFGKIVSDPKSADFIIIKIASVFNGNQDPGSNKLIDRLLSTVIPDVNLNLNPDTIAKVIEYSKVATLIVVVDLNRPAILSSIDNFVDGLVGTFGVSDEVIFKMIFGDFNPTGKLPFEIPKSMNEVSLQKEDLPDDTDLPTYSFGFGLSY